MPRARFLPHPRPCRRRHERVVPGQRRREDVVRRLCQCVLPSLPPFPPSWWGTTFDADWPAATASNRRRDGRFCKGAVDVVRDVARERRRSRAEDVRPVPSALLSTVPFLLFFVGGVVVFSCGPRACADSMSAFVCACVREQRLRQDVAVVLSGSLTRAERPAPPSARVRADEHWRFDRARVTNTVGPLPPLDDLVRIHAGI